MHDWETHRHSQHVREGNGSYNRTLPLLRYAIISRSMHSRGVTCKVGMYAEDRSVSACSRCRKSFHKAMQQQACGWTLGLTARWLAVPALRPSLLIKSSTQPDGCIKPAAFKVRMAKRNDVLCTLAASPQCRRQ